MLFKKMFIKLKSLYAFYKTINKLKKVLHFPEIRKNSLCFRGADINDFSQLQSVYRKISSRNISKKNKNLLAFCAKKLILVTEEDKDPIGINIYYLNPRDLAENTIHEGFIGVLPEFERKGIASQMRKIAIEHFREAGFKGISSRISKNNLASLRSAEKLGFKPVEEYYDSNMKEERYYLVLNF